MTSKVYADCQPIYGGGTSCQPTALVLSKTILNPQTNTYVHDLGINDPRFRPGDMVTFQISITNTGSTNIGTVHVVDTLPSFLTFVQGLGSFDSSTNTISILFPSVFAGQTQAATFTTQILDESKFPSNQDTQCLTNQATATVENIPTILHDSAQFCIFHPVTTTPVTSITAPPATGPETLPLIGLSITGIGGMILLKKTKQIFQSI